MLTKNRSVLQNFADAIQHEWLETNGLGGWASSSIIGAHTRRYHGLLVAAVTPPVKRSVLLSKLDETIVIGQELPVGTEKTGEMDQSGNGQAGDTGQAGHINDEANYNLTGQTSMRYELGVNLYPDNTIQPKGNQYLNNFTKELFPQWEFEAGGVRLKKTIAMVHGENTVLIIYDVIEAVQPFTLELLPLMAARNCHSLVHEGPQMHWAAEFENGLFHNQPDGETNVFIRIPGASYQHSPQWFRNFQYSVEQYRGLDFTEDLFNHGVFSVELKQGDSLGITVSTEDPAGKDAHELLSKETIRRKLLISNQPGDELVQQLVLAADQFIVKRTLRVPEPEVSVMEGEAKPVIASEAKPVIASEAKPVIASEAKQEGASIIAGYHWFTDWGRDTMISLPGLCLNTGRYADAKKILTAFSKTVSLGMLPNRFPEDGEEPEYNNVDGTLLYFIAVYKYLQVTGDVKFVVNDILPVLKEIIDWHFQGTRYNIHVTEDGLLYSGEPGQQLTWMDARIGNWVVTPRMGKPVEVQALWYNALRIFAELLQLNEQAQDAALVNISAVKAKHSFEQQFWYEEGHYLYDNIDENGKLVTEFRPNQLFAISLPFTLIEGDKAKAILNNISEHLYTPVGLRTLLKSDARYTPVYSGDQYQRDSAYHEGTVWSWLLGPYVDALVKVKTERAKVKAVIDNFAYHLNEACIGSVSEIFDADVPHHPRGCIAQAWGVAEILRVIRDYQLHDDSSKTLRPEELKFEATEV